MTRGAYNPIDQRAQDKVKQQAELAKRLAAEQHATDIQWLMSDPRGRRLMRRWLAFCGVDRVPFTGDSKTFFRCGEQNVGLMLKAELTEHAIDDYLLMLREHHDEAMQGSAHNGESRS